jgi:hypothetical protein
MDLMVGLGAANYLTDFNGTPVLKGIFLYVCCNRNARELNCMALRMQSEWKSCLLSECVKILLRKNW